MPKRDKQRKSRPIGRVMHVSKSTHNLILKAEEEARIGDFVYDSNRRRVGMVFDFFGPVDAPLISVQPLNAEAEKLIGEPLFVQERKKR